ncbi:TetR/AcrR family transcriptional regulator [Actinoplanes sp. NPDC051851]|uniref:TetR/AcrR family transcriptional regulator n=1 Tax=Actinoplanes sp. NPDC051851 TaxID=3154753 RepID=UPI0034458564
MDGERPPQRRRGRPGHDQDAVLNAAVRLFNARGYDATSMFDVAETLGITKSTLYHHVSGKEQLLAMAVDRALDGLFEAAAQVSGEKRAIDRLERLISSSVLVLAERLELVTLLLRVRGNTEVEQHALARRREFDGIVTDLVKQAQAEGSIRSDVDAATAARLIFGMVNSLVEWYRPERGHPETLARTVVELAFRGLRTEATNTTQDDQRRQ